jgi:hypothetical protein
MPNHMRWTKPIVLSVTTLAACYSPPAPDERFEDTIVVTSSDEAADFATFQTFFVRPEIRVLDDSDESEDGAESADPIAALETIPDMAVETMAPAMATSVIDTVTQNLIARGYRQAATKTEADLAVEIVYLRTISSDYYCYYWSDWYYWGYPGYSYYYPYSCDTAEWRSGMMVTNVVDLKSAGPARPAAEMGNSVLRGVWFSGIYGVQAESSSSMQRAVDGIDQSFEQSPYLTASPTGSGK